MLPYNDCKFKGRGASVSEPGDMFLYHIKLKKKEKKENGPKGGVKLELNKSYLKSQQ
jgi:hypothetical protein